MKFSIVGTGNAAWHFARMLLQADHSLLQVYARQTHRAEEFCAYFGGEVIVGAEDFSADNDFIIVAVSDQAIEEISARIPSALTVVHASGATRLDVMPQQHKAVIWPMQSLTEGMEMDYSHLPLAIEASDETTAERLLGCFSAITDKAISVSEEQRQYLHLAAVWTNNFSNYMYRVAENVCKTHHLNFSFLHPLMLETAQKAIERSPSEAQTGPAQRGDLSTIRRHMDLLRDQKSLMDIYRQLSEQIMNNRNGH